MAAIRRVTRPRSRNGCITCKIRHIKCDEEKPGCLQCQKSGRKCDGYDNASQTQLHRRIAERHRPVDRATLSADHRLVLRQETHTERRYVDFFYSKTSNAFSGFYDSKLWSYLIPQFGEHEPSVRHAMTAIGAIHSRVQSTAASAIPENGLVSTEQFVLEKYNKSIQTLVTSLSAARGESINLTLTTCCLFICLEMLRGNPKEALDHIESGLRIIYRHEQTSTPVASASELYIQLRDLFIRLNIQASFMGRIMIPLKLGSLDIIRSGLVFADMHEARNYLDQLMTKSLLFIRRIGVAREERDPQLQLEFEAEQEQARQEFLAWRLSHDKLLHKLGPKIQPTELCASHLLRIYYHAALVWILVALERSEDLYDNYTADFGSIICHTEEIIRINSPTDQPDEQTGFSLEGEIIGPLYFTAFRCRHPVIRRKALDILFHYPKREGMWDARSSGAVAKCIMDIEESQCAVPPTSEKDIGSLARVYEDVRQKDFKINPTEVVLFLKPDGVHGRWKLQTVKVEW